MSTLNEASRAVAPSDGVDETDGTITQPVRIEENQSQHPRSNAGDSNPPTQHGDYLHEDNKDHWRELWEKVMAEEDRQKRLEITNEINHTFLEQEKGRREGRRRDSKGMSLQVLLVEDSPGDVRLTQEAFYDTNQYVHLHVAKDGAEAIAFLRKEGDHANAPRPDLILLDLRLPKIDGHQVLAQIKSDDVLKTIPTVILSASQSEDDVLRSYQLHACYLSKPAHFDAFRNLVESINDFWLDKVKLPQVRALPT